MDDRRKDSTRPINSEKLNKRERTRTDDKENTNNSDNKSELRNNKRSICCFECDDEEASQDIEYYKMRQVYIISDQMRPFIKIMLKDSILILPMVVIAFCMSLSNIFLTYIEFTFVISVLNVIISALTFILRQSMISKNEYVDIRNGIHKKTYGSMMKDKMSVHEKLIVDDYFTKVFSYENVKNSLTIPLAFYNIVIIINICVLLGSIAYYIISYLGYDHMIYFNIAYACIDLFLTGYIVWLQTNKFKYEDRQEVSVSSLDETLINLHRMKMNRNDFEEVKRVERSDIEKAINEKFNVTIDDK